MVGLYSVVKEAVPGQSLKPGGRLRRNHRGALFVRCMGVAYFGLFSVARATG